MFEDPVANVSIEFKSLLSNVLDFKKLRQGTICIYADGIQVSVPKNVINANTTMLCV